MALIIRVVYIRILRQWFYSINPCVCFCTRQMLFFIIRALSNNVCYYNAPSTILFYSELLDYSGSFVLPCDLQNDFYISVKISMRILLEISFDLWLLFMEWSFSQHWLFQSMTMGCLSSLQCLPCFLQLLL